MKWPFLRRRPTSGKTAAVDPQRRHLIDATADLADSILASFFFPRRKDSDKNAQLPPDVLSASIDFGASQNGVPVELLFRKVDLDTIAECDNNIAQLMPQLGIKKDNSPDKAGLIFSAIGLGSDSGLSEFLVDWAMFKEMHLPKLRELNQLEWKPILEARTETELRQVAARYEMVFNSFATMGRNLFRAKRELSALLQ